MSAPTVRLPFAGRLARVSATRPWITVLLWVAIIALAVYASAIWLGDALTTEQTMTNDPEALVGAELLEERMPGADVPRETIVVDSDLTVEDPAYAQFMTDLETEIDALGPDVVAQSVSYNKMPDPSLVSKDGHATLVVVDMAGEPEQAAEDVTQLLEVVSDADADPRFTVATVGQASMNHDFQEVSEKDLQTGEMYGIGAALVVLVLVFASVVSSIVPIVLALVAITVAVGATAVLGRQFDFSFFIVNMITMMGLAVGIDYSLFVISRFREERAHGRPVLDAIAVTGSSASQAVLVSGVTVVLALLGMLLVPSSIFTSLSIGAILVVVFAVVAALTLLPAVLALLGDRVNALRIPGLSRSIYRAGDPEAGIWGRIAHAVMARPVVSLVVSASLLLALAYPYLEIKLGASTGAKSIPEGAQTRTAYELLEQKFGAGDMTPAAIVIDGDSNDPRVETAINVLQADLAEDADFGPGTVESSPNGDLTLLTVPISADQSTEELYDAVRDLRANHVPAAFDGVDADVYVTGNVAWNMDFSDTTSEYMPWVLGLVLSMSFVLLMVVFRSIVVPAKALLMNLLSVGAAYGMMVAVFQKGIGARLLGFQQVDVIEAWIPLFLFCVLFGLSMDYHVFLLSRIRERYLETGDNSQSVAFGLGTTARIITGAALIMVAVFGGFASGNMVMFQQMGFGLAVAVLLDATIIRTVLVPASMRLLGATNWWLPKGLRWLPKLEIEAVSPAVPAEEPPAA